MSSMAIFQLIRLCSRSKCKQLIAQTDTHNRFPLAYRPTQMLNGFTTHRRVAWSVRDEQAVILFMREIIIPRNTLHLHVIPQQAT